MRRTGCGVVVALDDVSVEITAELQKELTYAGPSCVHLYSTGNAMSGTVPYLIIKGIIKYNF